VSDKLHVPAFYPWGKSPRYPLVRRLGGPQSRSGRRGENSWLYRDSNSEPSVVQTVSSRYTDCAIPAPNLKCAERKCLLCSSKEKNSRHFMGRHLYCSVTCWQVNHVYTKHRRDTFLRVIILCFHKGFRFGYHTQRNDAQILGYTDVHINNPLIWNSMEYASSNSSEKKTVHRNDRKSNVIFFYRWRAEHQDISVSQLYSEIWISVNIS
jgi:hypothetical protein